MYYNTARCHLFDNGLLIFVKMLKKIYIISCLSLCHFLALSQKHDNIWLAGDGSPSTHEFSNGITYQFGGALMDFTHFPPKSTLTDYYLGFYVQSSIADSSGNLVAYTNGCHIANKNHQLMDNGDTINPGIYHAGTQQCKLYYPAFQGTIFLPAPGSNTLYYLFHMGMNFLDTFPWFASQRLYYSVLDASANNGLGKVIDKNHLLYANGGIAPYVSATKHANGRDWWVITTKQFTNRYYVFLLDPAVPKFIHSQVLGDSMSRGSQCCGQTGFSPDGTKYFNAGGETGLQLLDFDRCKGLFSNPIFIDSSEVGRFGATGVAISHDNHFMYVSTSIFVYQFDLKASDLIQSKVLLDSIDYVPNPEIGTFLDAMLAPDGKIYMVSLNYIPDMPVINFPERQGQASKVEQHGFKLPALYGNDFIFNFPHYRLGPVDGSSCDTLGIDNLPLAEFRWDYEDTLSPLQLTFSEVCSYEPTAWRWNFGDGNTSIERFPIHTYDSAGIYQACLIASNTNGADTLCKTLYLGTSAIENPMVEVAIQVFPNPFQDVLSVSLGVGLHHPVFRLFDQFGKLLHVETIGQGINELSTKAYPSGLYFWELLSGGTRVRSGKLVKMD
jgi:hypothetical protein